MEARQSGAAYSLRETILETARLYLEAGRVRAFPVLIPMSSEALVCDSLDSLRHIEARLPYGSVGDEQVERVSVAVRHVATHDRHISVAHLLNEKHEAADALLIAEHYLSFA